MLIDNPIYLLCSYCIIFLISFFSLSYVYDRLLEEQMSVIKNIKMIIMSVIYGAGMILINYMFENGTLQYTIAARIYAELQLILVIMLYPAKKKGVIVFWPLLCLFNVMLGNLTLTIYYALAIPIKENYFILVNVLQILLYLLEILTFKILVKTNYIKYLKIFLDFPRMCVFWFAIHVGATIYFLFSENNKIYYIIAMSVIAIIIFRILNKYANTSSETKVTNQDFLQVLLISNVKNDRYRTF